MKKSYHLRQHGLRITSGRHSKEFGLKPRSAITDEVRAWAKCNKKAILIERSISIGTALSRVIKFILPKRMWMQAELLKCGCDKYQHRMDRWGFRACFHKRRQIVHRLRVQAYRMGFVGNLLQKLPSFVVNASAYLMLSLAFCIEALRFLLLVALPKSEFNR